MAHPTHAALEEVALEIDMRISELKGDYRYFNHLSSADQRELDVLRAVRKALSAAAKPA